MWITYFFVCVICCGIIHFYRLRKQKLCVFSSQGIPGPQPHWIFGNSHQLIWNKHETFIEWSKTYGRTFGYYEGPVPVLYTADKNILKNVLVKNFHMFHSHKPLPVQPDPNHEEANMFFSHGFRWKQLRMIITPTFSAAKLKQMLPIIHQKVNILLTKCHDASKAHKPTDILQLFQCFSLDVIGEIAFGMEVDSQRNSDEPYLRHCRKLFAAIEKAQLIRTVAAFFPILRHTMYRFFNIMSMSVNSPISWLRQSIAQVIGQRKAMQNCRTDLLQLMLNADAEVPSLKEELAEVIEDKQMQFSKHLNVQPQSTATIRLNEKEIISQCLMFLVAGYETTSNALAYTMYLLARNQDKLTLLHNEIDTVLADNVALSYDVLKQLQYLDMCVCEALRIFPVAGNLIDRQCMEDCAIAGVHFTKGMCIAANIHDLHMDPTVWRDPHVYMPERFGPEVPSSRDSLSWIPFGAGPRNCAGMRLAMMEIKLSLAALLKEYTFVTCTQTEIPLQLRLAATLSPKNGVRLNIVKR